MLVARRMSPPDWDTLERLSVQHGWPPWYYREVIARLFLGLPEVLVLGSLSPDETAILRASGLALAPLGPKGEQHGDAGCHVFPVWDDELCGHAGALAPE